MSHCNITMRDRYSTVARQDEEIAILKARLEHVTRLLDHAENNLTSIFERIEAKEEVYLDYPDGRRIYIQAAPDPEQ